ncbi:glycine--tRNA ligase [Candidatus Woesearchaeota archaeon]|jgi:glycyl-tRNA synthetase|nr:glycine--tRNA ligase [Candidatus Woesearchaeota archaeon]
MVKEINIEELATFCKKKGFVYQNSEIYGGLAGFFDFGPLGVELKNNIKNSLWKKFVTSREDVVGIDGSIISKADVWKASGHVDSFADVTLRCNKCKTIFRGDHLIEDTLNIPSDGISAEEVSNIIKKHKIKCTKCEGTLKTTASFNLMFKTNIGVIQNSPAYLRPETAQLIFINFKSVQENSRLKLPFGIAQLGKAFRNEISPRDFLFRMREFEQFELEFFTNSIVKDSCPIFKDIQSLKVNILTRKHQKEDTKHETKSMKQLVDNHIFKEKWQAYWVASFYNWFLDNGMNPDHLRIREHLKKELAHYADSCFDIEYKFPFGWKEIHGNANRAQFDLKQHMEASKRDLSIFDTESHTKTVPYVIAEPSQGIERALLAFLFDAYNDDQDRGNIVLKLDPKLSPIKIAIFPLVNKPGLIKKAKEIQGELKEEYATFYDQSGSIGRRYARQDEIGTPACLTIDFDSIKNNDITLRDRNTTNQIRINISKLNETINKFLNGEEIEKLGNIIK